MELVEIIYSTVDTQRANRAATSAAPSRIRKFSKNVNPIKSFSQSFAEIIEWAIFIIIITAVPFIKWARQILAEIVCDQANSVAATTNSSALSSV